eukprot:m.89673 g.89673  ORF g.89673 m.89673 type:complete len:241 (-) comp51055_c0_seq1:153-875(-)
MALPSLVRRAILPARQLHGALRVANALPIASSQRLHLSTHRSASFDHRAAPQSVHSLAPGLLANLQPRHRLGLRIPSSSPLLMQFAQLSTEQQQPGSPSSMSETANQSSASRGHSHDHTNVHSHAATHASQAKEPEKLSTYAALKDAARKYGKTAVVVYLGLGTITLSGCYVAVSNGFDVAELMYALGITSGPWLNPTSGTFVIAYFIHKLMAPIRVAITLSVTPSIVEKYGLNKSKSKA